MNPNANDPGAPPGAGAMNAVRRILLLALAVVAALSIGGYLLSRFGPRHVATETQAAGYYCPMHPTYRSDRPGQCPICSMDLVPAQSGAAHDTSHASGDVPGLVGVQLDPRRVQMIGVRTATVEKRPLGPSIELVGFVTPDESRFRRVQLRVAGWVRELAVNRTGDVVRKGQPLLTLYSPELYQSEQEFLIELGGAGEGHGATHEAGALAAARERLRLLEVPDEEIARLERERRAETVLTLRAPSDGTVLERGVTEGQYVGPSTPLLTLADLSQVWLLADLYEMDLERVRAGDHATFSADATPGRVFEGRVDFIYPTVSAETRTVKARIGLDNRDGDLRPGMFGRVKIAARGTQLLTVPLEAIVRTGEHEYVFVVHEGGHFEPRLVTTGKSGGEWVEIVRGLELGETVVASASFLIDSESRLKAALSGMGSAGHGHGNSP
jgi:Cu(I)/Ag(I) efflux system membrane fusion protein